MRVGKCPKCNQTVSREVYMCPYCKFPVRDYFRDMRDKDKKDKNTINIKFSENGIQVRNGSKEREVKFKLF